MSFGPPTRQVYFCVSHTMPSGSCPPNPEASLEPSTAAGRRGGSQDFRPGRRLERQGKARPRNAEAPEREGETPRWRRLDSARANDAAVVNAEASAFAMTVLARERTAGGGLQRAKKTTKKIRREVEQKTSSCCVKIRIQVARVKAIYRGKDRAYHNAAPQMHQK
jgi:hypothetical protein